MGKRKFPETKAGVLSLLNQMIDGFEADAGDFPAPPVDAAALKKRRDNLAALQSTLMSASMAYDDATKAFGAEFDDTEDDMKTDIKYAELVTKGDNTKLERIGWSGRAPNTPQPPPSLPRGFESLNQGKASAHFDWKTPKGGGAVKMYELMILNEATGATKIIGSTVETEITVTDLPAGKLIFVVVAVNNAGKSEPSSPVVLFF